MRKLFFYFIFLLSISFPSFAQQGMTFNPMTGKFDACLWVEEVDGSPANGICGKLKVTNETLTDNGDGTYSLATGSGAGAGAPTDATYITQTSNASLSAEQALASLATGIMKVTTTTGVISTATLSADISGSLSDETGSGLAVFSVAPNLSGAITTGITTTPATFAFNDTDVTHGVTTIAPTNTFLYFNEMSGTKGGAHISGFSDGTDQEALELRGIMVGTPDDGKAAITLDAYGASGTGTAALGATKTILSVRNNETEYVKVLGNGNTTFTGDVAVSGGDLTFGNITARIGEGTVDSITVNTDGTGDGEIVLENDSIGPDEIDSTTGAYDFGGVTSFEIPNGTSPTVDAAGEIAVDTTSDHIEYYGGAVRTLTYKKQVCFSLNAPVDTDDNVPFFFPREPITITDVYCEVDGGTSVGMIISDGTNALESITCDGDGAEDDGSIANGTFTALERMEFDLADSSGTNTWLSGCVTYIITED